jgi:hypothetical protein
MPQKPTVLAGRNTIIGYLSTGRPVMLNASGEVSTHKNIIVNFDGMETIIPTMYEGEELSDEQAIARARTSNLRDPYTRKPFPQFKTGKEAEAAEELLHRQLEDETAKVVAEWKKSKERPVSDVNGGY